MHSEVSWDFKSEKTFFRFFVKLFKREVHFEQYYEILLYFADILEYLRIASIRRKTAQSCEKRFFKENFEKWTVFHKIISSATCPALQVFSAVTMVAGLPPAESLV